MASGSMDIRDEKAPLSQPPWPSAESPFQRIPSYLLPFIISYIPIPHLQYRLVNKEWDHSMKIAHSSNQCRECISLCKTGLTGQLISRMQELSRQSNSKSTNAPWLLHWQHDMLADFTPHLDRLKKYLIPYLDSLQFSGCYSITLNMHDIQLTYSDAHNLASWCLLHSKPPKYNFFLAANQIKFDIPDNVLSFLCAPSMNHVSKISLHQFIWFGREISFAPLHNSDTVSGLRSLTISGCEMQPEDPGYLAYSPHLTNLTHLSLQYLRGPGITQRADHTAGFTTIICSPIMKNMRALEIGYFSLGLEYCVTGAIAQSQYLKNLTLLALDGTCGTKRWSLEPLLRCDATLLTQLHLRYWRFISQDAMEVITSPTSALFNRIECLDFNGSAISIASMRILCASDGLRSLKCLNLQLTSLADEHVELLSSASPSQFSSLQFLDLCSNNQITNQSVLALYAAPNLPSLQCIDFARCVAITADVQKELSALPARPNLRILKFSVRLEPSSCSESVLMDLRKAAPQLKIELV